MQWVNYTFDFFIMIGYGNIRHYLLYLDTLILT